MEQLKKELEQIVAGTSRVSERLNAFAPAFLYGGASFERSFDAGERETGPGFTLYRLRKVSSDGLIRYALTLRLYDDFPVVEWLPELENVGGRESLRIRDFQSLDAFFPVGPFEFVRLKRNCGSKGRQDDYLPEEVLLNHRTHREEVMECTEGRSSADWLPFFGLQLDGGFFYQFAVGWSGAWKCRFTLDDDGLHVRCGLRETDFVLHPGEKVRQASFFLVKHAPDCDDDEAQNLFRRFMLAYHSPRDSRGDLLTVPFNFACGGAVPPAMLQEMLKLIEREKLPFELLWMDAGWYGADHDPGPVVSPHSEGGMANDTLGNWWEAAGQWRVNRTAHPEGLRPYAEAAAKCGMKFMLWFEIERVIRTAPVAREHPEWFLAGSDADTSVLLDLALPEARAWALAQLRARVAEDGVSMIRIDFNFNVIDYWRRADAPDRIGLTETKYVMGLYELWDAIRAMLPDSAIDNCASGGRRLDFETLSRSFPMWRVDGVQTHESHQLQVSELSKWVPLHSAGLFGAPMPVGEDYPVLSMCGNPLQMSYFADQMARDPEWFRRIGRAVLAMRPFFMQDLYHLTPHVWDRRAFHALQCMSYDRKAGLVLAFRRPETPGERLTVELRHIDRDAVYEVTPYDGEAKKVSGAELARLTLDFPAAPGVKLLFFRKIS